MPKLKDVESVLTKAQAVLGSPATALLLQALKPMLPTWKLTPEQIAGLDARYADAEVRKAKARKRAGQ